MKKIGVIVGLLTAIASGVYFYNNLKQISAVEIDKKIAELKINKDQGKVYDYLKSISNLVREGNNSLARAAYEYHYGELNFERYQKMPKMQNPMMDMTIFREIRTPVQMARQKISSKITKNAEYRFHYARLDQLLVKMDEYRKSKLSSSEKTEIALKELMKRENSKRANPRSSDELIKSDKGRTVIQPKEFIQNQKIPQRAMGPQNSTINR